jgi:hypothetical protein
MYNFGVLSFQSLHVKFKVILIFPKSRICPLLILYSHFKIQKEFENSSKNKVVDLFFLRNFAFYRFLSCLMKSKVILKIQKKEVEGGCFSLF